MRERDIFIEALEQDDPARRDAFLAAACGQDAELRGSVERLLCQHNRQDSFFLDAPLAGEVATIDEPLPEAPGTVIGPYKLLEEIGEGGFGVVFMAEQTQPVQRKVALKIIKPGMDSRQVIARFEAERQALAVMDHPNIAKVHDGGATASGRPYFVMELVKGVPITRYCDEKHLSLRERLELFVPVCQAIQHAHQKGIIHRDIKPSNILVGLYDGVPVPKVIDFGVAKATAQRLTEKTMFTGFGQLVGTLEYMSPEQAQFNQLDIDTRSDIYSLGVLLYELLTGTTPFDQAHLCTVSFDETLRIIREVEPLKPSTKISSSDELATVAANRSAEPAQLGRQVKGDLDWIVIKCLEKDRTRRYQTASGLEMDLRRYLADEPVVARPPSTAYLLRKFVQRNRGAVLSASLLLFALVGGIIGTTWNMMRATKAQTIAVNEAIQKEAALKASQESERNARDKLWWSLYERARAGRFSRQTGQRLDSLAALADAARIRPDAALRDEAIASMALPDLRRTTAWRPSPPGTVAMAYGGLCRLYARVDGQGIMSIRRISDDHEIQRVAAGPLGPANNLYFSPDEQFVLVHRAGNTIRVWRVADGELVLRDEPCHVAAHAFTPDGRRLAIGQHQSVVYFDLSNGEEIRRWRLPARAHALAFRAAGDQLAVGYLSADIASVYEATSGNVVAELPVGAMSYQVVAWHPDGERLAVAGSDARIQIWNVSAQRRVKTLEGHMQNVTEVMFDPAGGLLASHSWDGTLRLWDPSTGRQLLQLPFTTVSERPRISRDGRWLWAGLHGERAELLEVTRSREYRTLVSSAGVGAGGYKHGDISPDGRLLAVGSEEGAVIWDLRSGRQLAGLPAGTLDVFFDSGEAAIDSTAHSEAERSNPSPQTQSSKRDGTPCVLFTGGSAGLLRWPITSDQPEGTRLRLGPPQQLSPLRRAWFARTLNGRALVVATEDGGASRIIDLETGAVRRELEPHPNGQMRALSGDGRWAASSGWHSDCVRLWNAVSGEMIHEWIVGKQTIVKFAPDSRTLIIARGDEFQFWDVKSLKPVRRLRREIGLYPGHVAFSPDGKLMALELAPAVIHLKEVASGRTVAKLEDPHGDRATWQGFTPDGTQLVVVTNYATAIHIWDLQAIRTQLKEMNLDWDWPEFAPADRSSGADHEEYTIDVVLGDREKD